MFYLHQQGGSSDEMWIQLVQKMGRWLPKEIPKIIQTLVMTLSFNELYFKGFQKGLGFLSIAELQLNISAECSFVFSGNLLVDKPTEK